MRQLHIFVSIMAIVMTTLAFQNCSKVHFASGSSVEPPVSVTGTPSEPPPDFCKGKGQAECERNPFLSNKAAVIYEDNFPNNGDLDYNDAVFKFSLKEVFNSQDQLVRIEMELEPKPGSAGYDHALMFYIDGLRDGETVGRKPLIHGEATVTLDRTIQGVAQPTELYDEKSDIVLIPSTKGAKAIGDDIQIKIVIEVTHPELNTYKERLKFDLASLRLTLYVKDTQQYVDIFQVDDRFVNADGYPFGLIVPTDFAYTKDTVKLSEVYPLFGDLVQFMRDHPGSPIPDSLLNWFLSMDPTKTDLLEPY